MQPSSFGWSSHSWSIMLWPCHSGAMEELKISKMPQKLPRPNDLSLKPSPTSPTGSDWPNSSIRSLCIRGLRWSSGSANLACDAPMCWECRLEVLCHGMYLAPFHLSEAPWETYAFNVSNFSIGRPQPHRPLHHFGSWWIQAGAQFRKVQRPNLILSGNWSSSDRSSC